jgi:tetratricopeptide (TPR) repeat protein
MERARKQVQLLDLYDDARTRLDQGDFESCMDKLDVLVRLDPAFEVTNVREQARLALVEKLYRQATELYQAQEYQGCLKVFEEIHARDPDFHDQENIAEQAQRHLKRQQYLKRLYDVSVEQTQREDWVSAQKALEELYRECPRYADVEARLTMVRYIARLSRMYLAAQKCFEAGDYTDCIVRLDELSRVNNDYKSEQILKLHDQAAEALYDRSERLVEEGQFERAMLDLDAFVEHTGGSDPRQIRDRIQDGIATRELNNRLGALYRRATGHLDARQYQQCLDVMKEIRRIKRDFADIKYVERRARDSLCSLLYAEALGALVRGRSKEAWEVWSRLRTVDPEYPDPQSIEPQIVRRLKRWSWLTFWKRV